MEQVTIYGRSSCGFCVRARSLCESRSMPYTWVDMIEHDMTKAEILVGDRYIGGYDEFSAYVRALEAGKAH